MIKVELIPEKPVSVHLQESQVVALEMVPQAGIIRGRDAYSPFISETGTWMCWSDMRQQWVDTGINAVGEKGDPGSDASVNAESIKAALGYVPAKPTDIPIIVPMTQNEYDGLANKDENTIYIIIGDDDQ